MYYYVLISEGASYLILKIVNKHHLNDTLLSLVRSYVGQQYIFTQYK